VNISEQLKVKLNERLCELSGGREKEGVYSSEFCSGVDHGTWALMDVIDDFFQGRGGMKGYLELLGESQLKHAVRISSALLKEIEDQDKVRIFSTSEGKHWFTEERQARQEIKDQIAKMDIDKEYDETDYMIHRSSVRESSLHEYLDPKDKRLNPDNNEAE